MLVLPLSPLYVFTSYVFAIKTARSGGLHPPDLINVLPKAPPADTTALGMRGKHEFGADKSIQTRHMSTENRILKGDIFTK